MPHRRILGRRFLLAAAGALVFLLLVATGALLFLAQADLAPHAARFASAATGRAVTLEALELGWQDGVTVDLRGLEVANAEWSETPEMAAVDAASAVIDSGALWRGVLRYERLRVRGVRIVLERGPDGTGNWEFGGGTVSGSGVPKDRTQFPTLLDAIFQDALITYRTSSGALLKIEFDEASARSTGDDRPVDITASGAYNDVAARIDGTAESFDALRDAGRPYGLSFVATTDSTTASFEGTSMLPLDFDGVDGHLVADATDTGDLARMLRAEIGLTFPLEIAGHLTRAGDDWRLDDAEGAIAGNAFAGNLRLLEAGRGEPDEVAADLDFEQLDIAALLGGDAASADGGYLATPLSPSETPGINIDADLRTNQLVFGRTRLADVTLIGRMAGRQITVARLGFALAGGRVTASGGSAPAKSGATVTLVAALEAIDAAELGVLVGARPGDVSGTVDGRAQLEMSGGTLKDALGTSRGHAVIAMNEGRIARAILEMASTDLRSLFRDQTGTTRIYCMLGILDLENGIGQVPVLKLRTADATLNGGGTVNLVKERVDLTFMTAPDSTGFFALDVPFRVHGSLKNPTVEPRLGGGPAPGEFATAAQRGADLPPELKILVEQNACRG